MDKGELPLFKASALVKERIPHVPLGKFPTSVERYKEFESDFGIGRFYVKRDDLSGEIYGGNKVRKLEFLLADALRSGASKVLTFGCAGSNHALATSIYARRVGLGAAAVLLPQPNAHYVRKNLLMHLAVGTELYGRQTRRRLRKCALYVVGKCFKENKSFPYAIPSGGTSPLGTLGYVNAGFELCEQIKLGLLEEPDLIYIPLGTCGTAAGLAAGLALCGSKSQIVCVRVVGEHIANHLRVKRVIESALKLLSGYDRHFPSRIEVENYEICPDFFGCGYGVFTKEGVEAVRIADTHLGIKLEGTYTGKTFAALLKDATSGKLRDKKVLFWNTFNSRDFSSYTKALDYRQLPKEFQKYFEEEVQSLDRKKN